MPDLIAQLLPRLQAHRLPDLELWDGAMHPYYEGVSILNLPSSICDWLGAPPLGAEPLIPDLLAPLGDGIRRVVMVLMDALSLFNLQRWMEERLVPRWRKLADDGVFAPLSSLVPSTTSAALTSLWTGRSPAEHGVVGYEMWLKEYGVVANMIYHAPASFQGDVGSLIRAGLNPETFLHFPTLGTHLAAHGVRTYAYLQRGIARSPLSQILFKNTDVQPFQTATDLWVNLRRLLESRLGERSYTWVYWGDVDHMGHYYGPEDERTAAEFVTFSEAFERSFLDRLSPQVRKDTLVILTADHGMTLTPRYAHYEVATHPNLIRRLHMLPTGEGRLSYLYIKPGHRRRVQEYVATTWPDQFCALDPIRAARAGLFGPGRHHPGLADRLGDLILAARGRSYLWWANKENRMLGRHGGLTAEEMLVPFLAVRL